MRAVILALLLVLPAAASAQAPARSASVKPKLPKRFDVRPPEGFRPSDTIEILSEELSANPEHPSDKIYKRFTADKPLAKDNNWVLTVHSELLDSKNAAERSALSEVLRFAKDNKGFSITVDKSTPAELQALRKALEPHGASALVQP